MNWRKLIAVAAELAVDLFTGKLERKPAPEPSNPLRHIDAERIARASREAGCSGCARPEFADLPSYGHTCGRPHIAREGARGYQCGGVSSANPCPACRARLKSN